MKQIVSLAFLWVFATASTAQTTYESSHVKNGETIQFTIPNGFYLVEGSDVSGDAMFSQERGVDFNNVDLEKLDHDFLMVIHEAREFGMSQEELLEELKTLQQGLVKVSAPEKVVVNGRDIVQAGFKGEMEGEEVQALYVSTLDFGDYSIAISYYAQKAVENPISFDDFEKIIASWKVVQTDREDELSALRFSEEEMEFEEETNYTNDLYETKISYYDVLPEYLDNWYEPIEENNLLLSEFTYKDNNGSVKVFSGGLAANYPTEEEMAEAITRVMQSSAIHLKYDSQFSNEDHLFKLYAISGGGSMTSVYTTIVRDELVFFVIDGGSNPLPDFKPAVRDFMLTMWVDEFGEMEEVPLDSE